ncbi:MAG TPA: DUF3108 domain-containing protein, partial [Pyrinomonadaceae bacterium]|nr:DUF3108 domain-containing protein [Pyrinomonadaceae bacterium]
EMQVVSAGRLDGRDVVELRSKFKTLDLVSATFFLIDQSRTTFVSPDTGLPVYIVKTSNDGPLPKETTLNFLRSPAFGYDLPSLIYRARLNGGTGTYPMYEGGRQYTVSFDPGHNEHIRVDAGEFDTIATDIKSDFFSSHGLKEALVYFSSDASHIPVQMLFRMRNGILRISLAAVSSTEVGTVVNPSVTPTPVPTIVPVPTQRPTPSPTPYVDDRALPLELNFSLGETLDYRVTNAGQPAGVISLSAKERKQVAGEDTLFLSAVVTAADPNGRLLTPGDHIQALVDPETLAPRSVESRFNSSFAALNQDAIFNAKAGQIVVPGSQPVDAPLGTHTPLSLIYAMRSFNLTAANDPSAAVNDTRVAVFWAGKTMIFSLHPGRTESIMLNGVKVLAQPISILTSDPQLDGMQPKVWLAADTRTPLRLTAGAIQLDLIRK